LKWHSEDLGRLDAEQRAGFIPMGRLAVARGRLWVRTDKALPCSFELGTGERAPAPDHLKNRDGTPNVTGRGSSGSVRGGDIGMFAGRFLVQGARRFWSHGWEWDTGKRTAVSLLELDEDGMGRYPVVIPLPDHAILPAWDDGLMLVLVPQFRAPWKVGAWDAPKTAQWISSEREKYEGANLRRLSFSRIVEGKALEGEPPVVWTEPVPLHARAWAVASDAAVLAGGVDWDARKRVFAGYRLAALGRGDGKELWSVELPGEPVYDGLAVDRAGRILVSLTDGRVVCVGRP
jgi:hypothetical protein